MKYKFQQLLHLELKPDNTYSLNGAMSPVLAAKSFCEAMDVKMHALTRLVNPQSESGYDHLIIRTHYKNCDVYRMFIDLGVQIVPGMLYVTMEPDEVVTPPVFLESTTEEAMVQHRSDTETRNKKDNPIMMLDEAEWVNVFKQLHEADLWPEGMGLNEYGKVEIKRSDAIKQER